MRKLMTVAMALALISLTIPFLSAAATDVSGQWELTINTPRGERTYDLQIEQDGEKIIVTMVTPRGETQGEGTLKGDKIEWTITRSTPRGEFTLTYRGTVEGNIMQGTLETGRGGTIEWTAKRKG